MACSAVSTQGLSAALQKPMRRFYVQGNGVGEAEQWISGLMDVILPQHATATKDGLLILSADSPIKSWITLKSEDLVHVKVLSTCRATFLLEVSSMLSNFKAKKIQKLPGPNMHPNQRVGRQGFPVEKRWFTLIQLNSQVCLSWAGRISKTFRSNLRQREPKEFKQPASDHSSRYASGDRGCNETAHIF